MTEIEKPEPGNLALQHFPLPWKTHDAGSWIVSANIKIGGEAHVADVRGWGYLTGGGHGGLRIPAEKAAPIQDDLKAYIVTAANAYPDLRAALKGAEGERDIARAKTAEVRASHDFLMSESRKEAERAEGERDHARRDVARAINEGIAAVADMRTRAEKAEAERDAAVAALAKTETLTVDAVRAAIGGHKVAVAQTVERAAWVAKHADLPDRPWTPGFYATARQDIAAAILADAALASNSGGGDAQSQEKTS